MSDRQTRIQRLLDDRGRAWDSMQAISDGAERAARDITAEERSEWDRLEARITELSGDLDRETRAGVLDAKFGEEVEDRTLEGTNTAVQRPADQDERRVSEAFTNFLRRGMGELSAEDRIIMQGRFESRAQNEGTTTAGGYLVPPGYLVRITEYLKAYGGLLGLSNVITTATGQPLQWPSNDDTSHIGAIIGENTQVTEFNTAATPTSQNLVIGTKNLQAWTYTSNLILVSLQLLQDSAFDLDSFITRKAGMRIGRALAAHLVNGTGTGQPTGILNAVTTGKAGLTGQTTSVIYDDVVDLVHSVDAAYRQGGNCGFLMNDLTLGAIRKIKSTTGYPLWEPNLQAAGDPDKLLGYPVHVDNGMPVMAASAKSIAFGDFEAGYVTRQVLGIQMMRLVERFADFLQVGFLAFARYDGVPDDTTAVKSYTNSAT